MGRKQLIMRVYGHGSLLHPVQLASSILQVSGVRCCRLPAECQLTDCSSMFPVMLRLYKHAMQYDICQGEQLPAASRSLVTVLGRKGKCIC